MGRTAQVTLAGFGRTSRVTVPAVRPERERDILAAVRAAGPGGLLARGGGRSYGDCALNGGGTALLMNRFDRLLAFDPATGELVCEAGVTMGEIVRMFLPRGFMLPVCPGSAWVTVGGAIANDVHGKNQAAAGSFGDHVRWLDLLLASGEVVRVAPGERLALFDATIGGVGLTGVVLRACIALAPVPSAAVRSRVRPVADLDAMLVALDDGVRGFPYVVAWVDGTAGGAAVGRGIVETAEPAELETAKASGRVWVPRRRAAGRAIPAALFTPRTMALWNALHLRRTPAERVRLLDAGRLLFPLDASRVYGRLAIHELHAVFPETDAGDGVRRALEVVSGSGVAPLLVVLKRFGRRGRGHLSFAIPGHSLVVDLPAGEDAAALLRTLETIVVEHGGRIYLAKDATLSAEGFARMYPELPAFRAVLEEVDPQGVFRSDLAARLRMREATA